MTTHYCTRFAWNALRFFRRTGVLAHINYRVDALIIGRRFSVPIRGGVGTPLLIKHDPWMPTLLQGLLDLFPGTFVDVGVNVGQTLCKVKAIAPERAYVGFEPNPACVQYVRQLTRLNDLREVRIVPVGLSDRDGPTSLFLFQDTVADPAASVVSDFRPTDVTYDEFIIPIFRFGTLEDKLGIGHLGIVKVDVEGGEREVLLGMEHHINKDRPAVLIEILPIHSDSARLSRQQDVEACFTRLGYRLFRVGSSEGALYCEPMTEPIGMNNDPELSNYVALPQERSEEAFKSGVGRLAGWRRMRYAGHTSTVAAR